MAWGNSWLSLQPSLRLGSASSKVRWTPYVTPGAFVGRQGYQGWRGNYLSKLVVGGYNWSSQEAATHRTVVCMRRYD